MENPDVKSSTFKISVMLLLSSKNRSADMHIKGRILMLISIIIIN
uniref:Uncharacterized protein n=1 Tax=Anguilla anguilla TaxID=7936 RepID=A0A0E9UCD5_ANGAN